MNGCINPQRSETSRFKKCTISKDKIAQMKRKQAAPLTYPLLRLKLQQVPSYRAYNLCRLLQGRKYIDRGIQSVLKPPVLDASRARRYIFLHEKAVNLNDALF
jgi:hypothetical protein